MRITPVVLSGGTGTRIWPLSRESYPKQLLPLIGPRTMLQETVLRTADRARFGAPIVVANAEHRFVIAEQLRAIGIDDATIVLEPSGRGTAPAAAVAALIDADRGPHGLVLVMPADHVIGDLAEFLEAVATGEGPATGGSFTLFGIRPKTGATGYGYVERGPATGAGSGAYRVDRFVEKPDRAIAERYVASGDFFWNSGIFLLPVQDFLEELGRFEPEVLAACRKALFNARNDLDFVRLDADAFKASPPGSIDRMVMERTARAVVVPLDCGWSDVGSWSTLWEIGGKDAEGNVLTGDVVAEDTRGSYLRSEGPLVATLGIDDVVVVATADVVLVTRKERDQDVKRLVERLKVNGHLAATQTVKVHRPWGYYQSIHVGERFQVKRITVNPGAKLSMQKHFHRAEHWVVVNGTALVTRDGEEILVRENESVFLPLGCVHRLANPGRLPLNLIEVQSGPYLDEDDIVRFDDAYARVEETPAPGSE